MQIHWIFSGCAEEDRTAVISRFQDRKLQLEGKIGQLAEPPDELRLAIHHESDSDHWAIQSALHLAGRTLVAESDGQQLEDIWDDVLGKLAQQMDFQLDEQPRISLRRDGLRAVLPFLEVNRRARRSEAFMAFLQPAVRSLHRYVRRELIARRLEEELPSEAITPTEVLDEVMIRAWERFERRPKDQPLDLWLVQLAHDIMDESTRPIAVQSLEERVPAPDQAPQESERDEWTTQATYPESIELGELLPEESARALWDQLDVETKRTGLAELLGKLPRDQRQALVLSAIEGFDSNEIGDFQGRSSSEVDADIIEAKHALQQHFEQEFLPEVQHEIERPGGRDRRRRRR